MEGSISTAHLRRDIPNNATREDGSPRNAFRTGRLKRFLLPLIEEIGQVNSNVRILDVGGAARYWEPLVPDLERLGCRVIITNITEEAAVLGTPGPFEFVVADGRRLDYPDQSFDLVHSNSVIEHVGSWLDMRAMAEEVRRIGKTYFVQTPNFWFPYELHFRKPFFHWLPEQLRARWLMSGRFSTWPKAPSLIEATEWVQRTRLIDGAQVKALFPDAIIERERALGMTKSLIAIRRSYLDRTLLR